MISANAASWQNIDDGFLIRGGAVLNFHVDEDVMQSLNNVSLGGE